ncbi:hypothetical protein B0H13DRAFT_2354546 [Mycena leptocephala]|nr:hypothetical protein B0H13DRAFT_2354546 [Mycena leptocephala]
MKQWLLIKMFHQFIRNKKRHREEIEALLLPYPPDKHRRQEGEDGEDGIKIIRSKHLKLIFEFGSGPGYLLHAGQNRERAVIVKVFNQGPTVRERLESTVALSKTLMHPNVLRVKGCSSSTSLTHFIVYESVHWKNAEGPLAAALKDDLTRSITLGFKMVAGLSAGMNYLSAQCLLLGAMGVQNFDIFLDLDDRFLISINPPSLEQISGADVPEQPNSQFWDIFNALCQKVLRSANQLLHHEQINRDPVTFDSLRPTFSDEQTSLALSSNSTSSHNFPEETPPVPPRREYVWRTIDRGQQSLASVARRIALDLDLELSLLNRLVSTMNTSPHRCAGYVREEITLATTTFDSAVVSHDAPSPQEICSMCKEVVGFNEVFQCTLEHAIQSSAVYASNGVMDQRVQDVALSQTTLMSSQSSTPNLLQPFYVYNGLPTNLPPPPCPIAQRSTPPKSSPSQPSFDSLRTLTMLAQNDDTTPAAEPTTTDMHSALQEINRLTASPEFRTIGDSFPDDLNSNTPLCGGDEAVLVDEWLNEPLFGDSSPYLNSPYDMLLNDFGTSPMDTPLSSFMATPSLPDMDPLIHDSSPLFANFNDNFALFGANLFELAVETVAPKLPATDKMWTISPSTPALDTIEPTSTAFPREPTSTAFPREPTSTAFPRSSAVIPPSPTHCAPTSAIYEPYTVW